MCVTGIEMKRRVPVFDFRQLLLLLFAVCCAVSADARRGGKNHVGISYFQGWNNYSANGMFSGMNTVREYDRGITHRVEIEYARTIVRNIELRTGLSAAGAYYHIKSNYLAGQSTYYSDDVLFMFSIPLHVKYCFSNFMFVEGGPDLNFHPSMGYKRGLGLSASLGAEYTFSLGLKLSGCILAQQNWLHLGVSDSVENGYTPGNDTLSQIGIKIGIGYVF
jgi:hypothetical protein